MPEKQIKTVDVWEVTKELQLIASNHIKVMIDQYKKIRGIYGGENIALIDAVLEFWPEGTRKFFEAFDVWLGQELQIFDKNLEKSIKDYAKDIYDLKFTAPNTDHYRMLVNEHTKLWIINYQKLKERRNQMNREFLTTLKTVFPISVHFILDNVNKWILSQYEIMDNEIIDRIKKASLGLENEGL